MNWYVQAVSLVVTALVTLLPGLGYWLTAAAAPETIRRTMPWANGHVFELSNVTGAVHIIAEDRNDVSVVATRTGEGEVGFKVDKQSYSVSFDQDGMKSFDDGKLQYQRIRYEGGDAPAPTRLRTRKANKR